jgi:hypothetical protein
MTASDAMDDLVQEARAENDVGLQNLKSVISVKAERMPLLEIPEGT